MHLNGIKTPHFAHLLPLNSTQLKIQQPLQTLTKIMPLNFQQFLERQDFKKFHSDLKNMLDEHVFKKKHGHLDQWLSIITNLPNIETNHFEFNQNTVKIGNANDINNTQQEQLHTQLKALMPWRKGPYDFFGTFIDTEWRSDWKWQRLAPHISDLTDKRVLDVGCGSGYHCWRMLGAGAKYVLGIDPTLRFFIQYLSCQKYIKSKHFDFIPVGIEHLPEGMEFFDTTFSMGILYHRRNMQQHLIELRDTLKASGELILETLVVDEDYEGLVDGILVPEDRYAAMRNVWNIPTINRLKQELRQAGFINIHCIEVNTTSLEEQRRTEWIEGYSLREFLDPQDTSKTREGYPAPKRATLIAQKQ